MIFYRCERCGEKGRSVWDDWPRGFIVKLNPPICDECQAIFEENKTIERRKHEAISNIRHRNSNKQKMA